jgi:hypothetical protein
MEMSAPSKAVLNKLEIPRIPRFFRASDSADAFFF